MVASTLLLTVRYKHSKGFVGYLFRFIKHISKHKNTFIKGISPYYAYTVLVAVFYSVLMSKSIFQL